VTQEFLRNPHAEARIATIDDITYPEELRADEARQELTRRGVHTQGEPGPDKAAYEDRALLARLSARLRQNVLSRPSDYQNAKDRPKAIATWLKDKVLQEFVENLLGPKEETDKVEAVKKRLKLLWTEGVVTSLVDQTLEKLANK
jgi:hypothetical protein